MVSKKQRAKQNKLKKEAKKKAMEIKKQFKEQVKELKNNKTAQQINKELAEELKEVKEQIKQNEQKKQILLAIKEREAKKQNLVDGMFDSIVEHKKDEEERLNAKYDKLCKTQKKYHKGLCVFCMKSVGQYGNSPMPLYNQGRCCDRCNNVLVLPERLKKSTQNKSTIEGVEKYVKNYLEGDFKPEDMPDETKEDIIKGLYGVIEENGMKAQFDKAYHEFHSKEAHIKKFTEFFNARQNTDIAYCWNVKYQDYTYLNKEELHIQMKQWRKSCDEGKITIKKYNNTKQRFKGTKLWCCVVQRTQKCLDLLNGTREDSIDPAGFIFDDMFMVSGHIYMFKSKTNRDLVYRYVRRKAKKSKNLKNN